MATPPGHQGWMMVRSYSRDKSVVGQKLAPGTVRRILRFAAPYKRWLWAFLGLIIIDAVLSAAVPLLYKRIIDAILGKDTGTIALVAGMVALIAVLDTVVNLFNRWYSARIGEGLIYDMRAAVFSHVQRMPLAFFTRTQTGALISRLNNDVLGAQQAFTGTLSSVVSNVISVVIVLAAMLVLSWQITSLSLLLLPIFIIPARLIGRRLAEITRESYSLNAEMNATMTERFNVAGALLVKLFGRPEEEDSGFRSRARRVADIGITSAMYARIFFLALTLVAALATAVVYGVGGWFAVTGSLSVSTVVALTAYLNRLYGPLTALSNVRVDVMTALVSFERVFEVLDLPPMIQEKAGAVGVPNAPTTLEFDRVSFRYPSAAEVSLASLETVATLDTSTNEEILRDVSFRIEPGQMIALVGPSGAGKTTIAMLAARLYDATDGSVRIGGIDVRDATFESLRASIGMVTQDAHLFHDTIRANLLYARPEATEEQLYDALRGAQIYELVASLPEGLDTVVGERGYRLSGGEKQRLAIARLLLKQPGIVVLDEATAHLDSESEVAVQRALKTALEGRTSLVIAHRLSTIREANLILVLDDGRIVERGSHDELLAADGLYSELYRTQYERQAAEFVGT